MNELFKEFEFNKKTEYTINEINGNLLPKDYLNFMLEHNGGEGNVGNNSYMQILKLEELIDYNNDYDIFKLFPTCFAFETDLGGNHFCYNFENKEYFAIDSILWSVILAIVGLLIGLVSFIYNMLYILKKEEEEKKKNDSFKGE